MSDLNIDMQEIEDMITSLKDIYQKNIDKECPQLHFKGNFTFTEAYEEFRTLMECTHLLWANLAANEASLLRGMQQNIKQQDEAIAIQLVLE